MQNLVYQLFNEQLKVWELAREKYAALESQTEMKKFEFGKFSIFVKYNPARFRSATALIDLQSIAKRRCFLCAANRPQEQTSFETGDFEVLVNPYPIFDAHFTIANKNHTPQVILPYFADFMRCAKKLPDFAIFYNGAACGASAPDHVHFQAVQKEKFPVINDYKSMFYEDFNLIEKNRKFAIFTIKNYLRKVIIIEAENSKKLCQIFENQYFILQNEKNTEPMMNLIIFYENGKYRLFIFPRRAFRPTQFYEKNLAKRLIISPGTVEMSGMFVTPLREDYDKITKEDIISIYEQVSG
jgi:ATP adenylyltransferase/5',5'''-P-1,P-4-tetraphosphate phosphorylase II